MKKWADYVDMNLAVAAILQLRCQQASEWSEKSLVWLLSGQNEKRGA